MSGRVKPFLKWGGGKYRLVPRILGEARVACGGREAGMRYVEPFLGGGSVFLGMGGEFSAVRGAVLADTNKDLVDLYNILAGDDGTFLGEVEREFVGGNTAGEYYKRRDEFNSSKDGRRRAALFVYLNRHCYNGLCRYNAKGGFNTPFGKYVSPVFPKQEMGAAGKLLNGVGVMKADFREVLQMCGEGDFVYCDPPYLPLDEEKFGEDGGFTAYSAGGFSLKDQIDLAESVREAWRRGAVVVVSNHDTTRARRLYSGGRIVSFPVARMISCKAAQRARAQEILAVFDRRAGAGNP